jgi:NitT/TauT family transport system substrate-binding protein
MAKVRIQFTLFSAFYSPLIATMAGGFLREEGLEAAWSVAPKGVSAIRTVEAGEADLCQSAVSQGFAAAARGEPNTVLHFAQINEMDGFFLTAREPDPAFDWKKLEGAEVVLFGGGQPLAMFQYACHRAGIDFDRIVAITPGGAAEMDAAFRQGQGAYVQQQGPFPQQLEADGIGHIVAQVGRQIGPNAFSSLAATPEWLATDEARAFTRAYRKARVWMNETPAAEIARAEEAFFPRTDEAVLARCIASYQKLGCWTPHLEITRPAFEVAQDVFRHAGALKSRVRWEQVCCDPPAG